MREKKIINFFFDDEIFESNKIFALLKKSKGLFDFDFCFA